MERLEQLMLRVTRWLALGAVMALLALSLITTADILMRWLAGTPILGLVDASRMLTAVAVVACLPALIARRGNLTIRFVGKSIGLRATRWLDAFGSTLMVVFFALMTWEYVGYSAEMGKAGERLAVLRWPTAPWWWAVTAVVAVAALVSLAVLLLDLVRGRPDDGSLG